MQGRSQDCSEGGGGGSKSNVSDGGPTVHQVSMLSCYCKGRGGGVRATKKKLNTPSAEMHANL